MAIKITMPALSPTMESGTLAKWLIKEGDEVTSGDVIAEIETDKATMEVEAVDEGVVGKILVAEGTEEVPVNEVIAVLLEEGEDASVVDVMANAPVPPAVFTPDKPAEQTTEPAPAVPAVSAASNSAPAQQGERIFASPLARRIAGQEGIDIGAVKGTGPRGRIIKRDIEAALASGVTSEPAAKAAPAGGPAVAQAMPDDAIVSLFKEGTFEVEPHDGMKFTSFDV